MQLTFTRTGERDYQTVAVRNDGVTVHIPSFDRPTWLPHDLAHYVVEQVLHLQQGFWGCVAAGAIFEGMTVIEGCKPHHGTAKSQAILRKAAKEQQGTQAEVLVDFFVKVAQQEKMLSPKALQQQLRDVWQPSASKQVMFTLAQIQNICADLTNMQEEWRLLPIGQGITVEWKQPAI